MSGSGFKSFSHVRSGLLVGASFFAAAIAAQPAWAQDAAPETSGQCDPTKPDSPECQEVRTTAAPAQADDAIVVTGSRIRSTFNSPDPITVIDPKVSEKEGKSDLASTLQSSPIAAGSTQITAALSSNFVTNGGPGAQTIDLRGLGANRTLVLLNGRRAGPAGTRGGVSSFDLNVLPQALVSNIQILKTGASSIYGSDAVAGVVNIITRRDTKGLELSGNASVPIDSGGEQYRLSAIWGKTFDRGHILLAADYTHQNELRRGDRDYLACPEAYTFREDGSRADLIDPRTGAYKCEDLRWGHIWTYDRERQRRRGPGNLWTTTGVYAGPVSLLQYQYPGETLGIPPIGTGFGRFTDFVAPAGWFPTGYDTASLAVQNSYHPFVEEQTIIPKTDLYTVYAQGAFEVSDSVELFGEFLANRRKTYQNGWRQFWSFGGTYDIYGTIWAQGFEGWNWLSPTGITNHADNSQKVDYYRGVAGARGDIGSSKNWHWDTYVQYSKNIGRYRSEQMLQEIYDVASFQTASCVGTTLPISGKQCIDLPWADPYFLAGQMTDEQADFLFDWEEGKTKYTQATGEFTVSGDLIDTPAGPVGVAFGATIRKDKINDTPGAITLAGNAWGASASGITAGDSVTKELFGEINVPFFKDKPFAKELSISAAARMTNVKTTRARDGFSSSDNGNWTYKLAGNWALNDWLRFRASWGTSFRAPALFEQVLADESSFVSQRIDPCINWGQNLANSLITQRIADNCALDGIPNDYPGGSITATSLSRGGIGKLKSETSRAFVAGVIFQPKPAFLPDTRISLAVDYFDIKVKGEITQLGAANIVFGCYNSENFGNEPLCDLFTREPAGSGTEFNLLTISDQFVNIASQRNSGVDLTMSVRHDLGHGHSLGFIADMTWQTRDNFQLLPSSVPTSDNGESGSPSWVGDFRLTYDMPGKWSLFYGLNVIGKTSDEGDFLRANGGDRCINSATRGRYCPKLTVPMVFYHNASVTKGIGDKFEMTLGVSNIFDKRPPRVSVLNGGQISMLGPVVAASQYSFLGRRAFINVSRKF